MKSPCGYLFFSKRQDSIFEPNQTLKCEPKKVLDTMKSSNGVKGQIVILGTSALIFLSMIFVLAYRTSHTERMLESLLHQASLKNNLELMGGLNPHISSDNANTNSVEIDTAYDIPKILLIGDSITQYSFDVAKLGWGSIVSNAFIRKADVINRGFSSTYTHLVC